MFVHTVDVTVRVLSMLIKLLLKYQKSVELHKAESSVLIINQHRNRRMAEVFTGALPRPAAEEEPVVSPQRLYKM